MIPPYISHQEVQTLIGCGATWLRELRKLPDFPKPFRLGNSPTSRLKWRRDEIQDWMETKRETSEDA